METCKICNKTFKNVNYLSSHITKSHKDIQQQEYYDKYFKSKGDGICKICENETNFISIGKGYKNCCSDKCNKLNRKRGTKEKYGVDNVYMLDSVKNKIKETNKRKYGTENAYQSSYIKAKIKETNLKRYGVENPNYSQKIRKKIKATNLKKYGVEYPYQNENILQKCHRKSFKLREYKNTGIFYQGTYEFDFLEKYYNKYPDIQRGPRIKYNFNDNEHYYFPDFYIPSLNLIIECKNNYLYDRYRNKINSQEKAAIKNGYKYIIIINKNYKKLKEEIYGSQ